HADFAELKAWLLAKWLWNPDLPADPLLKDFFEGYYGAAAPFVREYFDGVHAFYGRAIEKPLRIFEDIRQSAIPDAFLDRAAELWRRAEEAAKDSPPHAYNVRMGAIPVLHARLARQATRDEIKVWVTRDPARYAVPPEQQALAATLVARFDEAKNVRISEGKERHDATLAAWRALASPPPLPPPQDRATVEDGLLTLARRGTWGDTAADPLAGDGSALKLFNTHYEWCTTLPFSRVAFDPGATYRLRMRARVEAQAGREGEAFWTGVYDPKNKKSHGGITRKTAEVGDGYAWYNVAEWVPEPDHYFWVGPGRFDLKAGATSAIRALYIDCIELSRAD
ncbi:MAG: DUF4838 domain-containing protein, partial [Planctomycetes bacterium]|nr:DUF4838 domain-containing protein [Planctomycetota bacterium]